MPQPTRPQGRRFAQDEMPTDMQNDWLQRLARFYMRFGRFIRDAIGVLLIAFALMSLFAVLGYLISQSANEGSPFYAFAQMLSAKNSFLYLFAEVLSIWFGLGSF